MKLASAPIVITIEWYQRPAPNIGYVKACVGLWWRVERKGFFLQSHFINTTTKKAHKTGFK